MEYKKERPPFAGPRGFILRCLRVDPARDVLIISRANDIALAEIIASGFMSVIVVTLVRS